MEWISSIPKWLFAASFSALVILFVYLASTGVELRYTDGIRFVDPQISDYATSQSILAVVHVRDGRVVSSTEDVSFNKPTGMVSFPNPENRMFLPLLADASTNNYMARTHFVRDIPSASQFRVWSTPLDTGDRNSSPTDFIAVVVAY